MSAIFPKGGGAIGVGAPPAEETPVIMIAARAIQIATDH